MGKQRPITFEERQHIEKRLKEGLSIPRIALEMGRHRTAFNREVKRCEGKYDAEEAQSTVIKGFAPIDFDIVGKKFGMLKILMYSHTENRRTWWRAKCDCGYETRVSRKYLVARKSKKIPMNCGCQGKQKSYHKNTETEMWLLAKFNMLKKFIEEIDGCWIWTGYINKRTQCPMTSFNGKVRTVKRMFYEILHPEESKDTQWVYSSCGDRYCVNPDHIVAGRPPKGCYYN